CELAFQQDHAPGHLLAVPLLSHTLDILSAIPEKRRLIARRRSHAMRSDSANGRLARCRSVRLGHYPCRKKRCTAQLHRNHVSLCCPAVRSVPAPEAAMVPLTIPPLVAKLFAPLLPARPSTVGAILCRASRRGGGFQRRRGASNNTAAATLPASSSASDNEHTLASLGKPPILSVQHPPGPPIPALGKTVQELI